MSFKSGTSLVLLAACLTALTALQRRCAAECDSERALRSTPRSQWTLSAGTNAQRVRPNHRSPTASELPRQLFTIRARAGCDLYKTK